MRKVRSEANLHVCGVHHKGFALANCSATALQAFDVLYVVRLHYILAATPPHARAVREKVHMQSAYREQFIRSAACAAGLAIMPMLMHVMCTLKYGRRSYNRHLITASFYIY